MPGEKTVIAQMFEWNWESVAAECTNFLGPAGYGYVQGALCDETWMRRWILMNSPLRSEPAAGAYPGPPVVDGLPTRIIQPGLEARRSHAVRDVRLCPTLVGSPLLICISVAWSRRATPLA